MAFKNYTHYDNDESIGSIEYHYGLDPKSEIIENYFLFNQKLSEAQFLNLSTYILNHSTINIIMNMYVYEEFRRNGYGSLLLEHVINNNLGVTLLLADINESPFIVKFYEEYGFKIIDYIHGLPLMIFEPE